MDKTSDENRAVAPPGDSPPAAPSKCVACDRQMASAAVCDYCHTLNPITAPTDYFHLLGLPRRFDLDTDQLRGKYLALNRHSHPDFHTRDDPEVQRLSLSVSSAINDAYRTLRDPIMRAEYLVELLGGGSSADEKSVPDGFLGEMMALQEKLAEAAADGDEPARLAMKTALEERLAEKVGQLTLLFAEFDEQVGCEGMRLDQLSRLRRHLNAISYIRRLALMAAGK